VNTVSAPSFALLSYIPLNTLCLKAKAAPAMKTTLRWPVRGATAQNPIKSMGSIRRHVAKSRSFILVTMTGTSISPGALITFTSSPLLRMASAKRLTVVIENRVGEKE